MSIVLTLDDAFFALPTTTSVAHLMIDLFDRRPLRALSLPLRGYGPPKNPIRRDDARRRNFTRFRETLHGGRPRKRST